MTDAEHYADKKLPTMTQSELLSFSNRLDFWMRQADTISAEINKFTSNHDCGALSTAISKCLQLASQIHDFRESEWKDASVLIAQMSEELCHQETTRYKKNKLYRSLEEKYNQDLLIVRAFSSADRYAVIGGYGLADLHKKIRKIMTEQKLSKLILRESKGVYCKTNKVRIECGKVVFEKSEWPYASKPIDSAFFDIDQPNIVWDEERPMPMYRCPYCYDLAKRQQAECEACGGTKRISVDDFNSWFETNWKKLSEGTAYA